MAFSIETDAPRLKRIVRLLVEAEKVSWHHEETDNDADAVESFVDSDWAACVNYEKVHQRWRVVGGRERNDVTEQHAGKCPDAGWQRLGIILLSGQRSIRSIWL